MIERPENMSSMPNKQELSIIYAGNDMPISQNKKVGSTEYGSPLDMGRRSGTAPSWSILPSR